MGISDFPIKEHLMNDYEFRKILDHFSYSWSGYRKVRKGVKKRLTHHMVQLDCGTVDGYLDLMARSLPLRPEFYRIMSVPISRFFRDKAMWQMLVQDILPCLLSEKEVRVWFTGCASGEEVYTFQICWDTFKGQHKGIPELRAVASDLNPYYIRRALDGIYTETSLKEIPYDFMASCFIGIRGRKYAVKESLKKRILWVVHDNLKGPLVRGCHILFIRNSLLTYYREKIKIPVLENILEGVIPDGYVIIGGHERIPDSITGLRSGVCHPCVYQKI
jgi:chemotaxis protein methyltransferase CheR